MRILEVNKVVKNYNQRCVVNGVSLTIEPGQIVGLLGPNGSGKTTCFNMIIGLTKPDEGQVIFDGKDITNVAVYQRAQLGISYLPQEPSIFHHMSVENNILAVLELQKLSKKAQMAQLEKLMHEFKISHLHKAKAISLSGGERRRLEIARTIAMQPKLILLDEPFVGIDPIAINEIQNIILKLKSEGISFLITDHSVYQALRIIDVCYVIYKGDLIVGDVKENVINNPKVKELYLGENFNYLA